MPQNGKAFNSGRVSLRATGWVAIGHGEWIGGPD